MTPSTDWQAVKTYLPRMIMVDPTGPVPPRTHLGCFTTCEVMGNYSHPSRISGREMSGECADGMWVLWLLWLGGAILSYHRPESDSWYLVPCQFDEHSIIFVMIIISILIIIVTSYYYFHANEWNMVAGPRGRWLIDSCFQIGVQDVENHKKIQIQMNELWLVGVCRQKIAWPR